MKHGASIFGFGMFWARISFPVPTYGCTYISAPFIVSDFLVGFSSLELQGMLYHMGLLWHVIPVVLRKAVAEVSKIGNHREGEQL